MDMSKNIDQVFIANPITTNASTDLMYFGQSPYALGDDAAMTFANFQAQFSSGITAAEIQNQDFTYASATGTNTYALTLTPALSSYIVGQYISFQVANANTTASTINVNGLGAIPIALPNGIALSGSELLPGLIYAAIYNADDNYTLLNPSTDVSRGDVQQQKYTFASAGVSGNDYSVSLVHAPTSYTSGMYLSFITTSTNTGASTMNVNGLGAVPIRLNGNIALSGGEIGADGIYELIYNIIFGTFILINSSLSSGSGITTINADSGSITGSTVIFSGGSTGLTTSGSGTTLDLVGILLGANGGTGVDNSGLTINLASATTGYVLTSDSSGNATWAPSAGGAPALTNTHIFVGNASNVATDVAMSGDATMANTGAIKVGKLQNVPVSLGGVDTGTANVYAVTYATDPGAAYVNGQLISFTPAHNNTGASTINVNGHGARGICLTPSAVALVGGELQAAILYFLQYSSSLSRFILLNSSLAPVAPPNLTPYATITNIQNQGYIYAVDTGAANAYVVATNPSYGSLDDGSIVAFQASNTNTGASTLTVNGLATVDLLFSPGTPLIANQIIGISDYLAMYNNILGAFILLNPTNVLTPNNIQVQSFTSASDTGSANAYVVALNPPLVTNVFGTFISVYAANNNTGASTLDAGGGALNIITNDGLSLVGGEILAGINYQFMSNGGNWQLINSSLPPAGTVTVTQLQNGQNTISADTTNTNNYVFVFSPPISSYVDGQVLHIRVVHTNTGAITIDAGAGAAGLFSNTTGLQISAPNSIKALGDYLVAWNSSYSAFTLIGS
jgi:hypothetical protein